MIVYTGPLEDSRGLIQFVPDLMAGDYEPALRTVFDVAADVGLPVTFTLAIGMSGI